MSVPNASNNNNNNNNFKSMLGGRPLMQIYAYRPRNLSTGVYGRFLHLSFLIHLQWPLSTPFTFTFVYQITCPNPGDAAACLRYECSHARKSLQNRRCVLNSNCRVEYTEPKEKQKKKKKKKKMTSSPLTASLGSPRPFACSSTSPLNGRNDVVGVPVKPPTLSSLSLADGRTTILAATTRKVNTAAGCRCSRRRTIQCGVALRSDSATSVDDSASISASVSEEEDEGLRAAAAEAGKVGARVRVKVPLKVFHVPRVPEVDLTGMEGQIKQYVGLWKGKCISANLPFKVEFVTDIEGRGPVKFFAHLKEDEFEYIHST